MVKDQQKAKRNRSLTGCGTCRQRHLKCDEARPACRMCTAFGVPCPGYQPALRWANEGAQRPRGLDEATSRRTLFMEPHQKAMTQMMVGSLAPSSVSKALDGLDGEGAEQPGTVQSGGPPRDRFHGPFGVLYLPNSSAHGPMCHPQAGDAASSRSSRVSKVPQPVHMSPDPSPLENYRAMEGMSKLLQYFKRRVVSFSYAARHDATICPWQTIHVPAAEKAHDKMLLDQVPMPVGLSLLYSLLAASCIHLAPRDTAPASKWVALGEQYKQEARQHLDVAIQEEILSLTRTNYEELLMALLSMTMLEILCAKYNEAEYLLLEAEYLIRTRGLPVPTKSPQRRTLHHVYTYLRILTESTCGCILRNICSAKPGARRTLVTEASRHKLRSFCVADHSTESDLQMTAEKSADAAHDDLHLEVMGDWRESLFPQLYGLPESLLGLLSQTIRLANEQELLHRDANVDLGMIANLGRRTKVLKHNVLSWKRPCETAQCQIADSPGSARNARGQVMPVLADTFHQAAILFYYRRVQNINGLMLQDRVRKVLDGLSATNGPGEAAQLLWPACVAACEAIEPPLREGLSNWLAHMAGEARIPVFNAVAELARQVWALREERQDYTLSWFDVTTLGRCPIVAL
ncbi:C6 transcription factor [Cordyceps militaris CM01]|uniref:C6 transcription factor n=1 Tax=Cordyceps militaris (strain CM01) TaxID=983644 RepID=G3JUX6_CORMM|nr:C6 transcription factor [Cordyceps militaris CM01]EGX87656.1 C6 transcription factor [Cordyceps militaris CM01]